MADLLKWVTPDETAAEFFARQRRESLATGLPFIDTHVKLRPGHLLEVVGPTSSAKTELLIQVAANVISSDAATQNAGDQGHVVVFDCDGKFDFIRFIQILTTRLPPSLSHQTIGHPQGASQVPDVLSALQRFHMVRCNSSLELLLGLATLLEEQKTWQGPCRLILLDNIGAYTWQDRAAASSSFTHQIQQEQQHTKAVDAQHMHAAITAWLRELSQRLRCPVIVTKQAGISQEEKAEGAKLIQRELLTNAWQSAVTHRLLLLPTLSAGQALHTLLQGPKHTEVLAQWQVPGFLGPITSLQVTQQTIVQL